MRRIDLMQERRIITVEELEFDARLAAWLDQQEAKWQAEHERRGRSATLQEQQNWEIWRDTIVEQEWEQFCRVANR
jgi:hypothetical protein